MTDLFHESAAIISPCGTYRYRLERDSPGDGATGVIMVNPSTADAEQDDATIRKMKGFGARYGWGRIIVGNLFAFRSTDVRALASAIDPIGPENNDHLRKIARDTNRVIFAWGPLSKLPKSLRRRWIWVHELMQDAGHVPQSIGTPAKDGHPCHPLMLPYSSELQRWTLSTPNEKASHD